ncbi:FliA/WhiG family RNA polymerase sigma factor [Anoxybacter fermentans]|uniref:FliA/WhiG family RNA polymerase sigma factor n=1 Tax=Anoxybacter fermentans TaxID=1323375 RepID=UPI001EFFC515|nr:FliA/WhiG family RNA polymerase sigma factor [Anoxybacter fermentans]
MEKRKSDEKALWKAFQKGDLQARNLLIEKYTPLVKYVAGRVKLVVPPQIEFDDLVSFGIIGLIQAIDRFDPERGVKFSTYAAVRIRGAIIDELRAQDWISRSSREKAKRLHQAYKKLEQTLGRLPEDEEVARELGLDLKEYNKLVMEANIPELTSLESLINPDSGLQLMDQIPGENERPEEIVYDKEIKRLLVEAIDRLKEQEKLVLALYYYEELTQMEIAQVLDLSPARVSQIHAKAVLRLRGMLSRKRALFL